VVIDWNEDWSWAVRSVEQIKPGENFDVYPCPFCGFWHVGHSDKIKAKIYFGLT
jgi:predicted RNA-binding Zn-ribbon protein involved in translation (DUF1610 family)